MSDFVKFCPKCGLFFRDPDLFARHFAVCGTVQQQKTKSAPESADTTPPDGEETEEPETADVTESPDGEKPPESADTVPPRRGRPPKFPN